VEYVIFVGHSAIPRTLEYNLEFVENCSDIFFVIYFYLFVGANLNE